MSSFALKIFAIIAMLCDHISDAIFKKLTFLNIVGRMAFPIFAFQITEGYEHTKNMKKFILRLFLFAILCQIPFSFFLSSFGADITTLNIFFTLLLGVIAILCFDKCKNKVLGLIASLLIIIISEFINVDYGGWGVGIIFIFFLLKKQPKWLMVMVYFFLCLFKYIVPFFKYQSYNYIFVFLGTLCAIIPILLYNGKQGRKAKYFFYLFYPIHMILLTIISYFI